MRVNCYVSAGTYWDEVKNPATLADADKNGTYKNSMEGRTISALAGSREECRGTTVENRYSFDFKFAINLWQQGITDYLGVVLMMSAGGSDLKRFYSYNSNHIYAPSLKIEYVPEIGLNYTETYLQVGHSTTLKVVSGTRFGNPTFTWKSNDPSVAAVNGSGVVTANRIGKATITVTAKFDDGLTTTASCVVAVSILKRASGTYYIGNIKTNKFVDIEGPSEDIGASIHQWSFYGYGSQQWRFELQDDLSYTIQSVHSGLYLGVENNSAGEHAYVKQYNYSNTTGTRWMISVSSSGNYILTPRSGESSGKALSLASSSDDRGIKLQQNTYTDNDDFSDEWWITDEVIDLDILYDKGYQKRYPSADYKVRIENYAIELTEFYFNNFKIPVRCYSINAYESLGDQCKNGFGIIQINADCNHGDCKNSTFKNSSVKDKFQYHHKNLYNMLADIYSPKGNRIQILFTGYIPCNVLTIEVTYPDGRKETKSGHQVKTGTQGLQLVGFPLVLMCVHDKEISETEVFMHEIGHVFGVKDHYDPPTGDPYCIYGWLKELPEVAENLTLCSTCYKAMKDGIKNQVSTLN